MPSPAPPPTTNSREGKVSWWTAGLCVALAALFWPVLGYAPVTLDDESSLRRAATAPPGLFELDGFGHFRPLKNLLFRWMADSSDLTAWRALFFSLFLVTVVAVQRLATRLSGSPRFGLAVAACWALNPTTASAVAWLSAANVLVCLLGVFGYLYLSERSLDAAIEPSTRRAALTGSIACLVLALASHELAVFAPLLLSTLRWTQGSSRERFRRYAPGIAVVVAYLLERAVAAHPIAYRFEASAGPPAMLGGARYFFENVLLWAWPFGRFGVLLVDEPAQHVLADALCWALLAGAAVLAWKTREKDALVAFGLAWAAVLLAPVSNLVPLGNTPVAVHYLYLPSVGLAVVVCRAAFRLGARVGRDAENVALAVAAALCIAWVPETRDVIAAWGDSERLFAATRANYPHDVEVLVNLSAIYLREDRFDAARAVLADARRVAPEDPNVIRNSYTLLWKTDQPEAALQYLEGLGKLADRPEYAIRRAEALDRLERYDDAARVLRAAFAAADPRNEAEVRYKAGYRLVAELLRAHHREEAQAFADELVRQYPDKPELAAARDRLREAAGSASDPSGTAAPRKNEATNRGLPNGAKEE